MNADRKYAIIAGMNLIFVFNSGGSSLGLKNGKDLRFSFYGHYYI